MCLTRHNACARAWLIAAIPMDNPYCSCKLTPHPPAAVAGCAGSSKSEGLLWHPQVSHDLQLQSLWIIPAAAAVSEHVLWRPQAFDPSTCAAWPCNPQRPQPQPKPQTQTLNGQSHAGPTAAFAAAGSAPLTTYHPNGTLTAKLT